MLGDFGVLSEQIDQRPSGGDNLAANVIDKIVRLLPAEIGTKPQHHRLGNDQSLGQIEVSAHFFLVDLQALEHEFSLRQGARGKTKYFRYDDPLDLPGTGCAFVILDHGVEQGGNLLAHDGDERGDIDRRERV